MKDEAPASAFTEFQPTCFEKYIQQLLGWQRVRLVLSCYLVRWEF